MSLLDFLKKLFAPRAGVVKPSRAPAPASAPLPKNAPWTADPRTTARFQRAAVAAASLASGKPPERLELTDVLLKKIGSLAPGLRVGRLNVDPALFDKLPDTLACRELELTGSAITDFPVGVRVRDRLNLADSTDLRTLPHGLDAGVIVLRNCRSLTGLPGGMRTHFLDLEGCSFLESLPDDLRVTLGRLRIRDCRRLRRIPASVGPLAQLDLAGCPLISDLPPSLVVTGWIDLGQTAVTSLPPGCRAAELRWRSVPIDERIAFRPHEIAAQEVLAEPNAERRRVMLDRVGFDRFLTEVNAQVIDQDTDAGGPRKLLRVEIPNDEPLVCVCVLCPSTGRRYILRVPPQIRTCHAAIAWTAGFDDPDLYRPEIET